MTKYLKGSLLVGCRSNTSSAGRDIKYFEWNCVSYSQVILTEIGTGFEIGTETEIGAGTGIQRGTGKVVKNVGETETEIIVDETKVNCLGVVIVVLKCFLTLRSISFS